ncbi:MAG TPA: DUF1257 domain-containing protein [Candidatus Xenobia bacterium]|jgi:hypothetical protein
MSGIFVLAPVLTLAPVVLTATSAAAAAMGFSMVTGHLANLRIEAAQQQVVQFDVAEARGLTELVGREGPIMLDRADASICFAAGKGRVQLTVHGKTGQSQQELEALGRSLLDKMTQQYAYHLVVSDLKKRGFDKVLETTEEDGTVRLQLRRWD